MNKYYIEKEDHAGLLIMSLGSIAKGFGGDGQKMGENASFIPKFRPDTDTEIVNYFTQIYGTAPESINFYLPSDDIDQCIIFPYETYNKSKVKLAVSNGQYFTYIANLNNPNDIRNAYVRDGRRCSDGQVIPHQPDLGFLGKPGQKMNMNGQLFVFVKELLDQGVFQTMTIKFHTDRDLNSLRKRLSWAKAYAERYNVPLTSVPFFIRKYMGKKTFTDQGGTSRRTDAYYLDLGIHYSLGNIDYNPLTIAFADAQKNLPGSSALSAKNGSHPAADPQQDAQSELENTAGKIESGTDVNRKKEQKVCSVSGVNDGSLFKLSDEQKEFVLGNLSPLGANYGVLPELLDTYKDKSGNPFTKLSFEDVLSQLKLADDYMKSIKEGGANVDKEKAKKAGMKRCALITAGLVLKNKYIYY